MAEQIKLSELNFKSNRGKIVDAFGNSVDLLAYLQKRGRTSSVDLSRYTSAKDLDRYFSNPQDNLAGAVEISNLLYSINKIYAAILDYLAGMYYWRYRTVPRILDDKKTTAPYEEIYNEMLEVVEGINIETVFPKLLLNTLKNGECYITTVKQTSSKTTSTILLPNQYCKKALLTQHNTYQIMFDLRFFKDLGLNDEELEIVLKVFPNEFKKLYNEWGGKGSSWRTLNSKTSTCFSLNDMGFPTYLSLFYDIIDYKTYKLNELDRNSAQLDTLVVQEIDLKSLTEANVVIDEIASLHDGIADIADNGRGSRLLTTIGKIKVEQMQGKESIENRTLKNMALSIFDNAGINSNLFFGDTRESLEFSLKRDLSYVWSLIEKISAFYNLAINNLYNFKGYQLSLTLLPISPYNESEKLVQYRSNASLGVGILDYTIASGIKQVDLTSILDLDDKLELNLRLRPLQSSHTQSSAGESGAPKREERQPNITDEGENNEE